MADLEDVVSPGDEGYLTFSEWASASPRSVEVSDILPERRSETLLRLGVTTRSVMGALAWHTGGVLLHHRWLRLLGGVSSAGLPDIAAASGLRSDGTETPSHLVVAIDALGGRFAVNGGGLPGEPGEVAYFGPDTLCWLPLGQGYSDLLFWALTGDVDGFYADLYWPGWEAEAAATPEGSLLSCYPPLFTAEARDGTSQLTRKAVPWCELLDFHDDMASQLADVPEGGQVKVSVEPKRRRRWRA